jgi:hypothetical protein
VRIAHTVPLVALSEVEKHKFHLVLPHLWETYPEYRDFYKAQVASGSRVVLDNGAYELGTPAGVIELSAIVRELQPAWVVLDDRLADSGPQAYDRAERCLKDWAATGIEVDFAAVAHGTKLEEIAACAIRMGSLPKVVCVCLPACTNLYLDAPNTTLARMVSRIAVSTRLAQLQWKKPVHLLGASDPVEYQIQATFPFIESADTTAASVYAAREYCMSPYGLGMPKAKELLDFAMRMSTIQFAALRHNMKLLDWWSGTGKLA